MRNAFIQKPTKVSDRFSQNRHGANQRAAMKVTAMQIRMTYIPVKSLGDAPKGTASQCKLDATSPASHNYGGVDQSPIFNSTMTL